MALFKDKYHQTRTKISSKEWNVTKTSDLTTILVCPVMMWQVHQMCWLVKLFLVFFVFFKLCRGHYGINFLEMATSTQNFCLPFQFFAKILELFGASCYDRQVHQISCRSVKVVWWLFWLFFFPSLSSSSEWVSFCGTIVLTAVLALSQQGALGSHSRRVFFCFFSPGQIKFTPATQV